MSRRTIIRNQPSISENINSVGRNSGSHIWKKSHKRTSSSSLAAYLGVFLLVMSIVAIGYQPPEQLNTAARAANSGTSSDSQTMSAIDDLVATNLAANIAQTANLPVAANVANLSQSIAAESVLVKADDTIVSKPQIVEPSASNREIQEYKTEAGDNVQMVADKYNVSSQTIKWSNSLDSDALEAGRTLKILPVDGVLYTVEDGDTVESIVSRYKANKQQLISFNDLEIDGLSGGKQLIIPSGTLPEVERPGYVAPQTNYYGNNYRSGGAATSAPSAYLAGASAGNRYAFGNCTWYVYERRAQLGRPVGSFWGNASTWASYAGAAGFGINGVPAPGAIMANGGGYGHVAVVESVNPGKSITISEMNGYRFGGGFNIVARGEVSWSDATSGYYQYIH